MPPLLISAPASTNSGTASSGNESVPENIRLGSSTSRLPAASSAISEVRAITKAIGTPSTSSTRNTTAISSGMSNHPAQPATVPSQSMPNPRAATTAASPIHSSASGSSNRNAGRQRAASISCSRANSSSRPPQTGMAALGRLIGRPMAGLAWA